MESATENWEFQPVITIPMHYYPHLLTSILKEHPSAFTLPLNSLPDSLCFALLLQETFLVRIWSLRLG